MAKIPYHGSNRRKHSTGFKCICSEKAMALPMVLLNSQTNEIRQHLLWSGQKHQSKNLLKTSMLLGYLPVKVSSHCTLNSTFVIKCEKLDHMEEETKKERQPQGIIAVKRICMLQFYMLWQSQDKMSPKNQDWLIENQYKTVHPQHQKMLSIAAIWTHKKFMQKKRCLSWMGWRRAQFRGLKNNTKCVNCQG